MRSRASFRSHPIHPALIPFPIAFLYGSVAFDLLGRYLDRASLSTTGGWLVVAGIVSALIAAVPGIIDYVYTVPPASSGKRRATKHMLVNLGAVTLFALAFWIRGGIEAEPPLASLALGVVGPGLLTAGGWMGGVLVSRNQISVDHRYAGAGKWSEARIEARPGEWCVVARADELEVDQMKLLHVDGDRVVLARTEDGWTAFGDYCTHRGASLADGVLMCSTVQCPWHGSQFDVRTGAVRAGPADASIPTFQVKEEKTGAVWLLAPARDAKEGG